ncbi:MAG: CPBP family intramembrane metalloprotease [Bryobacterales bacterium]|nr:CPBP family intramembrane metalloprotease [Bryobacterales bacterium]
MDAESPNSSTPTEDPIPLASSATLLPPEDEGKPKPAHPRVRAVLEILLFSVLFYLASLALTLLYGVIPNLLVISALSVFLGSLVATAVVLRLYHPGRTLLSTGLHWNPRTQRNLFLGLALGAGFGVIVTAMPVLIGKASWQRSDTPFAIDALTMFMVVILFGAIGEEVLFRGLVFQRIEETFGPAASVAVTSVLFAWAHSANLSVTWVALVNTLLWGVVFGVARLRCRDLWLPIGMHAAWNWTLPLLGVELSGFTLDVVGIRLRSEDAFWAGGAYGPEAGIFCTLAMPVVLVILWRARQLRSV